MDRYFVKQIFMIFFNFFLIYMVFKLIGWYVPFVVAYFISMILEPVIKFCSKKISIPRKVISALIVILFYGILMLIIGFGIEKLFSETNSFLEILNQSVEKIINVTNEIISRCNINNIECSDDMKSILKNSSNEVINKIITYIKDILDEIIQIISNLPKMIINFLITIIATYFISSDKFYILDRIEFHLPRKWVKKIFKVEKDIVTSLSEYLKAEISLIFINFIIVFVLLNLFSILGFKILYPMLMSFFIMFVDALPILGASAVLIPWGIFEFINNNNFEGYIIIGIYILVTMVRQVLEPKLIGKRIGMHPIITLLAMYTGFEFLGVKGLLIGPIMLIIVKTMYSSFIDEGLVKSYFKID